MSAARFLQFLFLLQDSDRSLMLIWSKEQPTQGLGFILREIFISGENPEVVTGKGSVVLPQLIPFFFPQIFINPWSLGGSFMVWKTAIIFPIPIL